MSVPRAPALVPTSPNPGAISIFAPPKTGSTFLSAFLAALAAAALGAFQLWRPNGTRHHRLVGYVWVALMATVAFSGLFIHVLKMFGLFSPIHLLSIFTLYSLWNAVSQARRGDIAGHRCTMILLFWLALALTGVFTFWPGRIMYQVVFG